MSRQSRLGPQAQGFHFLLSKWVNYVSQYFLNSFDGWEASLLLGQLQIYHSVCLPDREFFAIVEDCKEPNRVAKLRFREKGVASITHSFVTYSAFEVVRHGSRTLSYECDFIATAVQANLIINQASLPEQGSGYPIESILVQS